MSPLTIADFRQIARRRLPKFVFDYVDGGAGDETTMHLNEVALAQLRLHPRQQIDVSKRSMETTVLGRRLSMPMLLGPTGLQRLVHRRADLEVAQAAGEADIPFVVSASTAFTVEEIADAGSGDIPVARSQSTRARGDSRDRGGLLDAGGHRRRAIAGPS
jgi:isopentenyl diphosphate isomerase/L-lactate dehydrogenase-like FMN-dependent dehydrogenase